MREFQTKNGVEVVINFAGFKEASALKRAIGIELLKVNIDLDKIDPNNIKSLMEVDITPDLINTFKNFILVLDTSPAVEKALFDCLVRCTYDHEKITKDTFEDIEAIADYYEVALNCMRDNLTPFFKNHLSGLTKKIQERKNTNIPK